MKLSANSIRMIQSRDIRHRPSVTWWIIVSRLQIRPGCHPAVGLYFNIIDLMDVSIKLLPTFFHGPRHHFISQRHLSAEFNFFFFKKKIIISGECVRRYVTGVVKKKEKIFKSVVASQILITGSLTRWATRYVPTVRQPPASGQWSGTMARRKNHAHWLISSVVIQRKIFKFDEIIFSKKIGKKSKKIEKNSRKFYIN